MNCVKLSERKTEAKAECKVAFIGRKFARGSKVSGMRAWIFHARNEKFDRFNFEGNCDFHYSTCRNRLRAQPRNLTRTSQLAWCKIDLQHPTNERAGPGTSTGFQPQSPHLAQKECGNCSVGGGKEKEMIYYPGWKYWPSSPFLCCKIHMLISFSICFVLPKGTQFTKGSFTPCDTAQPTMENYMINVN